MSDPVPDDVWSEVCSYRAALSAGHRYHATSPSRSWTAKPGSHDDGPLCGLFLGGIGSPAYARDLDGSFSRWHLQDGYHVRETIAQAFYSLRWSAPDDPERAGYFRLDASAPGAREVLSLFPVTHERYTGDSLPLEVTAEYYSPLLPQEYDEDSAVPTATLPVSITSVTVRNTSKQTLRVDSACFWPNLLGWRAPQCTSIDRPDHSWPGQTHAGNSAHAIRDGNYLAVVQTRHPERAVTDELSGEIAIFSPGPKSGGSIEACCKADGNRIDRPAHEQGHTFAWMEDCFRRHGRLPESDQTWTAHWDEALCSAVSRGEHIAPGESAQFSFIVVFDTPIVRFGDGRRWYRRYTETWGVAGRNALHIAREAAGSLRRWRRAIHTWQLSVLSHELGAEMLNELYFLNAGGSVWVSRWAEQLDTDLETPRLGSGEHAAILEGYDIGYYYYNTSDLWPYAWYAVWRWWPDFARSVFADLLSTVPMEIAEQRVIYRSETMEPVLVRGKVPHDLGSVMEDPWHSINGYQMRDDSNLWKDHNPAFILSLYLMHHLCGSTPTAEEWFTVREAALFALQQADPETGLPVHKAFGDSTWDNIGIRGHASYSAGFTVGFLAAIHRWAQLFEDIELAETSLRRLDRAQSSFVETLWNGEYYRICDQGTYTDCIMGDGILGLFLADLSGLGDMLSGIPRKTLVAHLNAYYRYCFLQYRDGAVGPLLVSAPGRTRFAGDGGDELQVNEVLPGSAWLCAAMLEHYGLRNESAHLSGVLTQTLHGNAAGEAALQFRTPAAVDGDGRFRAPMNMRPLSIWFFDAVRRDTHLNTTPS